MLFLLLFVSRADFDDVSETAQRNKTLQITASGDFKDTYYITKINSGLKLTRPNAGLHKVQYMRPYHEMRSLAVDLR
jgi:hypothetical protein